MSIEAAIRDGVRQAVAAEMPAIISAILQQLNQTATAPAEPDRLIGAPEVQSMVGVSRSNFPRFAASHADFPKPVIDAPRKRWRLADINRWMEKQSYIANGRR